MTRMAAFLHARSSPDAPISRTLGARRGRLQLFVGCLLLAPVSLSATDVDALHGFQEQVVPVLGRYCFGCHGSKRQRGDLDLERLQGADLETLRTDTAIWTSVRDRISTRQMPPQSRKAPSDSERAIVIDWIDDQLFRLDCDEGIDPGKVTLRRLTNLEYSNTIAAIFGTDFDVASDFLPEDVGHGFDNIGDVLSMSPTHMERYLLAAARIARQAILLESDLAQVENRPETNERILLCHPQGPEDWHACAHRVLAPLVHRAFRRPGHPREMQRLVDIVLLAQASGDSFEQGLRLAVQAVLVAPSFLFHVIEPVRDERPGVSVPLGPYEVAARLSYFLWRAPPDEPLYLAAATGELTQDDVLEKQTRRMLRDPRAHPLASSFAAQWLQLTKLEGHSPDQDLFPSFDSDLRAAMQRETELFFGAVVEQDRSILDFLDGDFTFLNETLARHYGIQGVEGTAFQRVGWPNANRRGILTHASILTLTSNPTRTSPVLRGKWILEQILGTPPPPPPADVEELPEEKSVVASASLRERLEAHREDLLCASCHEQMDPLGFALENFDATGRWREKDGRFHIDASGTLPGGEVLEGPSGLRRILLERRDDFAGALTKKMLVYALGRGVEYYDSCAVERIVEALREDDYRFSRLIVEVVRSVPFRMRRGREGAIH